MGNSRGNKAEARSFEKWINSYAQVSRWLKQYHLNRLLDENGGLVKISNFFPPFVADGVLKSLENIPVAEWNNTEAKQDYTQNNISHSFLSSKQAAGLNEIIRAISLLLPDALHSFSAAKYCHADHIAPHDDRAYTAVLMEDGQVLTCSRNIALIYYCTKDWKENFGGNLVDLETGKVYVPEFNSIIAFRVPRYHQVTKMSTNRPRLSIFGWFLEPGITYELFTGEDEQQPPTIAAPEAAAAIGEDEDEPDSIAQDACLTLEEHQGQLKADQPISSKPGAKPLKQAAKARKHKGTKHSTCIAGQLGGIASPAGTKKRMNTISKDKRNKRLKHA